MPVSRIQLQGKSIQLDRMEFLSLIDGIGKNAYMIAQMVYQEHSIGSLNANGSSQTRFLRLDSEEHRALIEAIEDEELREAFDELEALAEKLRIHDKDLVKWLGNYYGITSLENSDDRRRLNRKLSKERRKASEAGSGLLIWINETDYQALIANTTEIANELGRVSEKITRRVSMLSISH